MKKFIISSLALAGLATSSEAVPNIADRNIVQEKMGWVKDLVEKKLPLILAGHSSHSSHGSHGSHGSHRSSSGAVTVPTPRAANPTSPRSTLPRSGTRVSPVASQVVKKVQVELSRYNLYRGRIDGLLGPKTKEGIIRYQMAIGLPATGELDQTLLLVMGIR